MSSLEQAKATVEETIAKKPVVIFTKSYCPFCDKAKNALRAAGVKEENMFCLELNTLNNAKQIQDCLQELTGARTVPRVFINQKFFGGWDDTDAASKDGRLIAALKEANAL